MNYLKFGLVPDTNNLTHLVHVQDVSRVLLSSMKEGQGTYIVADTNPIKIAELFSEIVRLLGKKPHKIPMWFARLIATLLFKRQYFEVGFANRAFSIEKIKKELGFSPTSNFSLELQKMIDWYKSKNKA